MSRFFKSDKFLNFFFIFCILFVIIGFVILPKSSWGEGVVYTWFMSKGLFMFKDFASQYFPTLFIFIYWLHKIFGFNPTLTIVLSPLNNILLFYLVYFASKKWLRGWYRILPLAFLLFWNVLISASNFHTNPFLGTVMFGSLILWISWYKKPKKLTAALLGFLLAVALTSHQMVIFFVGIVSLSLIFEAFKKKDKIGSVFVAFISFLIPIVGIVYWLLVHSAWNEFYFWNIKWYFIDRGYTFDRLGRNPLEVLILFSVVAPILLMILALLRKKVGNGFTKRQLMFISLAAATFPVTFWFATMQYVRESSCIAIFSFLLGWGIQLLTLGKRRLEATTKLVILIVVVLNIASLFMWVIPKYHGMLQRPWKYNVITKVYKDDPMSDVIIWLRNNTRSNDKLFILSNKIIFFESDRLPSSNRSAAALPFQWMPIESFKEEIQKNPPSYWVVDEGQYQRFIDFGYRDLADTFWKMLSCEPVAVQFKTMTIRKHAIDKPFCW